MSRFTVRSNRAQGWAKICVKPEFLGEIEAHHDYEVGFHSLTDVGVQAAKIALTEVRKRLDQDGSKHIALPAAEIVRQCLRDSSKTLRKQMYR